MNIVTMGAYDYISMRKHATVLMKVCAKELYQKIKY